MSITLPHDPDAKYQEPLPPFQLNEVGYKVFMDRYAWKDHKKELKKGDIVVIDIGTDVKWKQKEPARVVFLGSGDIRDTNPGVDTGDDMLDVGVETIYGKEFFWRKRYQLDICKETTIEEARKRMAYAQAKFAADTYEESEGINRQEFEWLLADGRYVPAGRVWTALGTDQHLTMYNCFVIPSPVDSMEGIRATLAHKQEIMRRGGGVGINLSTLRPRGAYARGVNGRSSGSVSWGAMFSYSTGLIEQGGSRRGALMEILNIWHPDIVEFITSKNSPENIQKFRDKYLSKFPGATMHPHGIDNANISVGVTDEFMEALENDGDWVLRFPDYEAVDEEVYYKEWNGVLEDWIAKGYPVKEYETYKARDLWDLIIESAWQSAEPGLFFITRYNTEGNQWYYEPIVSTNPCGEQGLPPWGVCNLGHINLSRFVVKTGDPWEYRVDWNNLEKAVRLGVRFQDNLIDITPYFHEENEKLQKKERRIGMGTLGIAEMLIRLKLRYGSPESIEFLDDLYSQIACWAYDESMELARKRGAFEMFDADKYIQSGFMQRLIKKFPYLGEKIKEHGIRNVCLLTQAPTGTTGTMHATSTGIEPFYSYGWWRNSRLGRVREEIQVLKEWLMAHKLDGLSLDEVNLPDYFTNAMELTPKEHVDVQAVIQKWTDSSISKTTNAPANYTIEQTKELYEYAYRAGLKGLTIYRDSSRSEQVLELDKKEEPVVITGTVTALPMEFTDEVNLEDSDDEDNEEEQEILYYRNRRSVEPGFTHKMKTPIGKMYITVNFGEDDRLIEVFVNMSKPGQETNAFTQGLGRLISTMLKYNIPPGDIVKQLRGIVGSAPFFHKEDYEEKGELVKSICDGVGKIIEHYNGDTFTDAVQKFLGGPKPERVKPPIVGPAKLKPEYSLDPVVSGMTCPECGGNVIRTEGCQQCIECSWSKC